MKISQVIVPALLALIVLAKPLHAGCDHLFQPSQFLPAPHHVPYSPARYWFPLMWNVKAYHHGYHRQVGNQYHYPQMQVVVPTTPVSAPKEEPPKLPERLPDPVPTK